MSYSVAEAAAHMGVDRTRVYQLIKSKALTQADSDEAHVRVERDQVHEIRRARLAKFDLVADHLLDPPDSGTQDQGNYIRAITAENWLRTSAASRQLMDEALKDLATSRRILEDLLIAALPGPQIRSDDA